MAVETEAVQVEAAEEDWEAEGSVADVWCRELQMSSRQSCQPLALGRL